MINPSQPTPMIEFDYHGKHYKFPFKEGCNAGITITEFGKPPLYAGYTETELLEMIRKEDEGHE